MGINILQLREDIIRPVLTEIKLWSQSAENLLIGTASQESMRGTFVRQINGPALGIYQTEPKTYQDIILNVIPRARRTSGYLECYDFPDDADALVFDLRLATIICRLQYWRFDEKLPEPGDELGLASYWKRYYNTKAGRGTLTSFLHNYQCTKVMK